MKRFKLFLMVMGLGFGIGSISAQQIQGDFDQPWEKCYPNGGTTNVGTEPVGWQATNVYQTLKFTLVTADTGRNNSTYSVKMTNTYCGISFLGIGSNAPAYITLGNTWVYADMKNAGKEGDTSDGGTYGGISFTYRPDALVGYIKRTHSTEKPDEVARIITYLWKGTSTSTVTTGTSTKPVSTPMQDREKDILGKTTSGISGDAQLIASAEYEILGDYSDWQLVTIPLKYEEGTEAITPEKVNVIISCADYWTRPNIGKDNVLWADDFEFVYNSQLSALTYDGATIPGFAIDNYSTLDMSSVEYDASKLAYTSNGVGATVKPVYDESTSLLTLTVEGNDISANKNNKHVYTIQFAKSADYVEPLVVTINGVSTPAQQQDLFVVENADGTYDFSIKNFNLGGEMLVGDINLTNVPVIVSGNIKKYAIQQTIAITSDNPDALCNQAEGLFDAIPILLRVRTSGGRLYGSISIDMTAVLDQMILVTLGDAPVYSGNIVTGEVNAKNIACLNYAFSGSIIIENLSSDVTAEDIQELRMTTLNANDLIYIPSGSKASSDNVVVGDKAASIVITDKVPFHAPKAFTADAISYTRNCYLDGGWETIMLPFAVTSVTDNDVTKDYVLEKCTGMEKGNTITFARETTWAANTPYIISFGEATGAAGETKPYVFSGSGAIGVTEPSYVVNEFKGSYIDEDIATAKAAYMMNAAGTNFVPNEANSVVYPFRAYIDNSGNKFNAPNFSVEHDGGATGMNAADVTSERVYAQDGNIIVESATKVVVADLSGRIVRTINAPEEVTVIEGLSKGFYIVNGHKVFVK